MSQLYIGYQTLSQCSYLLKQKIYQELEVLSHRNGDARTGAACWELCVCFFAGFGVEKDLDASRAWLAEAAKRGVEGARAFYYRLHLAMGFDAKMSVETPGPTTDDHIPTTIISQWLFEATTSGYVDVLPDLRLLNEQRYLVARDMISQNLGEAAQTNDSSLAASFELIDHTAMTSDDRRLANEVTMAAATGQLTMLKQLVESEPQSINFQNENGDTALILAARCRRFPELDFLLNQQVIDGSICNWQQQNSLHFLEIFTNEEIKNLVPRFIASGANHDQEAASPELAYGSAPDLKPRIRADPILQAVMGNNTFLLQQLLEAIHSYSLGRLKCRVCESGSRYRKMVAMAIMLHNVASVELLRKHREEYMREESSSIAAIEVWSDQELLPVWQLALRGRPSSVVDLPESFCRALSHGFDSSKSLCETLQMLWRQSAPSKSVLYCQLQQSVIVGNIEAIDYIMDEARDRGFQRNWWWAAQELAQWPVFLSIRLGFRDVFEKLWSIGKEVINGLPVEACSVASCRCCREPFDYSTLGSILAWVFQWPKHKMHRINLSQLGLSFATTAGHQDEFFV